MQEGGRGMRKCQLRWGRRVTKLIVNRGDLERSITEGDNPVDENHQSLLLYSQVPWDTWNPEGIWVDHYLRLNTHSWPIVNKYREGKVKRTPDGEWKESETICLQSSRSLIFLDLSGTIGWLRTFCIMGRRVTLSGKVNQIFWEAVAKASLNRANVVWWSRPETEWSIHGQGEAKVRFRGGPNLLTVKCHRMNCG